MKNQESTCGTGSIGYISDCGRFSSSRADIVLSFERNASPLGSMDWPEFIAWNMAGDLRDPWGSWV